MANFAAYFSLSAIYAWSLAFKSKACEAPKTGVYRS
jgi:hypothetical protein